MSSQSCPVEQITMGSIGHDYGPLVMGVGKEDNAVQFPWACADLESSHDSVLLEHSNGFPAAVSHM